MCITPQHTEMLPRESVDHPQSNDPQLEKGPENGSSRMSNGGNNNIDGLIPAVHVVLRQFATEVCDPPSDRFPTVFGLLKRPKLDPQLFQRQPSSIF
jgi:hypothetical protein